MNSRSRKRRCWAEALELRTLLSANPWGEPHDRRPAGRPLGARFASRGPLTELRASGQDGHKAANRGEHRVGDRFGNRDPRNEPAVRRLPAVERGAVDRLRDARQSVRQSLLQSPAPAAAPAAAPARQVPEVTVRPTQLNPIQAVRRAVVPTALPPIASDTPPVFETVETFARLSDAPLGPAGPLLLAGEPRISEAARQATHPPSASDATLARGDLSVAAWWLAGQTEDGSPPSAASERVPALTEAMFGGMIPLDEPLERDWWHGDSTGTDWEPLGVGMEEEGTDSTDSETAWLEPTAPPQREAEEEEASSPAAPAASAAPVTATESVRGETDHLDGTATRRFGGLIAIAPHGAELPTGSRRDCTLNPTPSIEMDVLVGQTRLLEVEPPVSTVAPPAPAVVADGVVEPEDRPVPREAALGVLATLAMWSQLRSCAKRGSAKPPQLRVRVCAGKPRCPTSATGPFADLLRAIRSRAWGI